MSSVCVYMQRMDSVFDEIMVTRNKNKLGERKELVDAVGSKSVDLKDKFCYRVLQLSKLPKCKERLQTAMCCLE